MEGALDLNNVHELQSELSRLYRALEESDHDVRKYRGTGFPRSRCYFLI